MTDTNTAAPKPFAKLFDLGERGQLLVTTDYCNEKDVFTIQLRGPDYEGIGMTLEFGFETEEKRDASFAEYGEDRAIAALDSFNSAVRDLAGEG